MLNRVCCMSLHTAGLVIGCLESILSLLVVVGLSLTLEYTLKDRLNILYIIFFGLFGVKLISSNLLIVGTKKNQHLLVLPWLICSATGLILIFSSYIYILCMAPRNPPQELLFMVSFGLVMGVNIYIYNGIFTLYKNIKAIRKQNFPMILENEVQNWN